MSGKEKLENDYQSFRLEIETIAAEALRDIREKARSIKSEAAEVGESVELSILVREGKVDGKKS